MRQPSPSRVRNRSAVEALESRQLLSVAGPDAFGYHAEVHPYEAIDLVPPPTEGVEVDGVLSFLTGSDDGTFGFELGTNPATGLPNTFNFYGTDYTSVFVGTNGLITFQEGNGAFQNDDLTAAVQQPTIAPLWDDLATFWDAGDQVLRKFDGNRLIVEWNRLRQISSNVGEVERMTFQAILDLNTDGAGGIVFNYVDVRTGDEFSNGGSATVGIKPAGSVTPAERVLVSFNGSNNAQIDDGHAIRIATSFAPVLAPLQGFTVAEGGTVNLTANATDSDPGDVVSYAWDLDGNGTFEMAGQSPAFSAAGLDGPGSRAVRVRATDLDGNAAFASGVVSITNAAPVAAGDDFAGDEDATLGGNVLSNDSDPANVPGGPTLDTLTATLVGDARRAHGDVVLNSDGTFTYTPDANYSGPDSFQYVAHDDDGGVSATATVTLTVRPLNDAPVATADHYNATEDQPLSVGAGGVLSNDSDPEGDALTAAVVDGPLHGTLALSSNGTFTYTPAADFNGSDRFTSRPSDGALDGNTATVTIDVAAVNDAPVASPKAYETDEDVALVVGAPGVLLGASDVDGDALTGAVVDGPSHGTLSLNADGSFAYTPAANYYGPDFFNYLATDGAAGSGAARVDLLVRGVNDNPVAAADAATTNEDTPVDGAVLGNDSDLDGDTLTVRLVTSPANGRVVLNADGTFTYTPNPNYFGPDSFTYEASDGSLTATAGVTLNVTEVNDAPVAGNDVGTTTDLAPLSGDVLPNDTDADLYDGLAGNDNVLTTTLLSPPTVGSVVLAGDGKFTYTPRAGFSGTDSFTYQVSDGRGGSSTATVVITVTREQQPEGTVELVPDATQPGRTALVVNGTVSGEVIALMHTSSGGVEVYIGCKSKGTFNPTGRLIVHAAGGNDLLLVGPGVQHVAWLYGEDGNDAIVLGHGGGIAFGGSGNDLIGGGNGRDILVGGEGADWLIGNPGDDILISAVTVFDNRSTATHESAWAGMYAEWTSGRSFADRVNNLRNGTGPAGRLNGSYFLNDSTVDDDLASDSIDILTGSSGTDWFIYKFGEDLITGLSSTEAAYDQGIM